MPVGVTVGLTDGRSVSGRLLRFRPSDPDLLVVARSRDSEGRLTETPERFATEQVAWVGIHRDGGAGPAPGGDVVQLDVRVAGGLIFTVSAEKGSLAGRLGFWAIPTSASSVVREVFFFAHGVRGREERVAVGRVLDARKRVGEPQVAAAAPTQRQAAAKGRRARLGEILVEAGLARPEDVAAALEEQKRTRRKRVGDILVAKGIVREIDIAKALAARLNIPFVDLDEVEADANAVALVPADLIQRYRVLPLRADATALTVALADPLAFEALDRLRLSAGRRIVVMVADPSQIARAIEPQGLARSARDGVDQREAIFESLDVGAPSSRTAGRGRRSSASGWTGPARRTARSRRRCGPASRRG